MKLRATLQKLLASGTVLALTLPAFAGTRTFNFDTDPGADLQLFGNHVDAAFVAAGGNPDTGGYLSLTDAADSQNTVVIFPDIDNGVPVKAFTFSADIRAGNSTDADGRPADGFSISYARSNDPVFDAAANNPDGVGGALAAGLHEAGTTTGIAIGFDVWSGNTLPDGADIEGLIVRVDNVTVLRQPLATRNGECTDTNSIQTGPWVADSAGDPSGLCWAKLEVSLDENGKLNVSYKGAKVLDAYQTTFIPTPGRLVLAGRTGGNNQNQHVDNIVINTTAASLPTVSPLTARPDNFLFTIDDAGTSVLNPSTLVVKLNGTTVATTQSKTNSTTTAVYQAANPFAAGATNTVLITYADSGGNTNSVTRTFVTPAYAFLTAAQTVTNPDTTKPGFRIRPHQILSGQPNNIRFTEEELAGLHGDNQIDLAGIGADAAGFVDRDQVIDYKNASGGAGSFTIDTPFTDLGIPGGTATTEDNSAFEAITFVEFPARGNYVMGVDSDDGFNVKYGPNYRDVLAGPVAGVFDGGRGLDGTGTRFNVYVDAPGIYPMRLLWENGGGGAGVEWYTLKADGTEVLLNDVANGGLKAYRAVGSALPPFVSIVQPYAGSTDAFPITPVSATINDGTVAVNDSTVTLKLNGAGTPTVTRAGGKVTATLTSTNLLASGSTNTAVLTYQAAGSTTTITQSWTFVVAPYATLSTGVATPVGSGDATKPGFNVKTWQADDRANNIPNNLEFAEGLLAGRLGTNQADLTAFTSGIFAEETTINYALNADENNGNFTPDRLHPGIPGVGGSREDYVSEFTTYVEFPTAGFYRMGVNSDDNFRTTEGTAVGRQYLEITGPVTVAGGVAAVSSAIGLNANLGGPLPLTPISGPMVYLGLSCNADPALPNLAGKIAFIERGVCGFAEKAIKAQAAGAIAVVIGDNEANAGNYPIILGGDAFNVTIPVLMIDNSDTVRLKGVTNLTATIGKDTNLQLGEFNGNGRGAADTIFGFVVPQPGVYPIRTSYMQGGGGGNVEWFSVTASGEKILLNDTSNANALKAFRARTGNPVNPTVSIALDGNFIVVTYTGTLQAANVVTGTYEDVPGISPLRIPLPVAEAQKFYRARN